MIKSKGTRKIKRERKKEKEMSIVLSVSPRRCVAPAAVGD